MPTPSQIIACDLFCGAGGFSSGLIRAAPSLGAHVNHLAVNHWDIAIETHTANHPGVRHLCESLDNVDPKRVVPGGKLDLLMASPECTHHSNARGGKPIHDQSRATAWHVLRWAEALYVRNIIIENVPEFRTWGPLGANRRPLKGKEGAIYQQFLRSLRALGYTVEDRVLNAADYGDATTRKRLFIQARRNGRPSWPEPTHFPPGEQLSLFGEGQTWRPAREIIDWSIPGTSIYRRKRPLADNTLRRIFAGLRKFSGLPFIVPQFSESSPRSVGEPIGVITTTSRGMGLCEPFVIGQQSCAAPRDTGQPLPTVAGAGAISLVEPYLVVLRNHQDGRSLGEPVPALTTGGNMGLAEPFFMQVAHSTEGHGRRVYDTGQPLPTLTAKGSIGLVNPYLVGAGGPEGAGKPRSVEEPLGTVMTENHRALAEPYIVRYNGGDDRHHSTDRPMPTLDTSNRYALSEPFLVSYYGNGGAQSVDEPLDTVTARDRFALVSPELVHAVDGVIVGWLDIRFRMLQPHELAAAMSFPEGYRFAGSREATVKQIGNAVPCRIAEALCRSALNWRVN